MSQALSEFSDATGKVYAARDDAARKRAYKDVLRLLRKIERSRYIHKGFPQAIEGLTMYESMMTLCKTFDMPATYRKYKDRATALRAKIKDGKIQ